MRFGSSAAAGNAIGKGLGSIFAPNSDATAAGTLAGMQIKNLQGQIDERAAKQAAADAEAARTSDAGILKTALLAAGVQDDAAVRDYQEQMATGKTPERYQLPADAAGPTMDKPAYLSDGTQKNLLTMMAALRATGGGAKSLDDFAKFQEAQQGIGFRNRYVDPNTPANEVARLGSVTKSSDIYKTGENGARLDVYGGKVATDNPMAAGTLAYRGAQTKAQQANAAQSYAQARSADAAAGEHEAGAGLRTAQAEDIKKNGGATSRRSAPMSATLQKELIASDDAVASGMNVISALKKAKSINQDAYSGFGASALASGVSKLWPGDTPHADKTVELDNLMTGQALEQLKSTFGGMPTEGERKVLLDMQASSSKTPKQREEIINRAIQLAETRAKFSAKKARAIRSGAYLSDGFDVAPDQADQAGGSLHDQAEAIINGGTASAPAVSETRRRADAILKGGK